MNAYVLSAAVGLLVGVIYGVLNVRSPAPPVIALVGLLGILAGEQIPPLVKHWLQRDTHQAGWIDQKVRPHMFGEMPGCERAGARPASSGTAGATVAEAANTESRDA